MKTRDKRQTEKKAHHLGKKFEARDLQTQDEARLRRLISMVPGERNERANSSETHAQEAANLQK